MKRSQITTNIAQICDLREQVATLHQTRCNELEYNLATIANYYGMPDCSTLNNWLVADDASKTMSLLLNY